MRLPETRRFVLEDGHDCRLDMSQISKFEIVDNFEIDQKIKFGRFST